MGIKRIKAFTLAEMLVTLALTSILITFCYMSFNYTEKLLNQFNQQSLFITQLNELSKRGHLLMNLPGIVIREGDEKLIFRCDSIDNSLEFGDKVILMKRFGQTDTFHLASKALNWGFEPLTNPFWQNKLVNAFEFDIYFQKQKFHLTFHKNYDALTKLKLEKEE